MCVSCLHWQFGALSFLAKWLLSPPVSSAEPLSCRLESSGWIMKYGLISSEPGAVLSTLGLRRSSSDL